MKSKIVIAGCSFSLWKRQKTWANHVKEKYTDMQFIDIGHTGTSNEYLLPEIIKYASNNNSPTIYIIQLTGLDRICINGEVSPTPTSLNVKTKFNPWGMFNNDRRTAFWIDYFSTKYDSDIHYQKLLTLILEFQELMKSKPNSDYLIFSGWDVITNISSSNQFDLKIPYININDTLIKDNILQNQILFNQIDFKKFWFFSNEYIKYGGLTQYTQYNLNYVDWYRDINANPIDFHPSDKAHEKFAKDIIFNLINKML